MIGPFAIEDILFVLGVGGVGLICWVLVRRADRAVRDHLPQTERPSEKAPR